ncbi:UPF0481 protein At3g47200-like [Primulina eburnea]|uniref:UPF0481 protein At3g47200-like n=1 Tax=Primulina eburnea TaxID=1245227 RepID=UPI003C6C0B9F
MQPGEERQVCISISQKLDGLTPEKSKNFIFKLHSHLRNVNDRAYEPHILAIGPYHRDKDNVKMMEEHKFRYLQSLLECKEHNISVYVSAIGEMEQEARKCYAEPISLNAAEFTEMLVLDGCFVIELVRKYNMFHESTKKNDPIFGRAWMRASISWDLMLFENQIPFFVLCKLFDLIEVPNNHSRLMYLALKFMHNIFPGKGCRSNIEKSSNETKHLLELIHFSWRPLLTTLDIDDNKHDGHRTWRFINSATELRNANVKLKRSERGSLFDIRFENGYLLLPPLYIGDRTESFFRNLIAYEQYFGDAFNYVTDYVTFLHCLINSSGDVEILCRHGIMDNWLGDGKVVSNMFIKLGDFVSCNGQNFIYSKIFECVNAYCERRRNRWMANLKQHHLNSPWAIMSILAAIILLLLTATQTVFSGLK